MTQALVSTEILKSLLTVWDGTGVAPDDGRTQSLQVLIHTNETMHLIRNTDGLDLLSRGSSLNHDFLQTQLGIVPPHLGILLSPTSLDGRNRRFFLREECRCYTLATVGVNQ